MDNYRQSLKGGSCRDRLARATSFRNFVGAKKEHLVPKIAIQNLQCKVGLSWTAHICVQICGTVQEESSRQGSARRPRYNLTYISPIFDNYTPELGHCQVKLRQTDHFDDPENIHEIVLDVLKLSEYFGQVIKQYGLENCQAVKEDVLKVVLSFLGEVYRSGREGRVGNLPASPVEIPESCAEVARAIQAGRSGSPLPADPEPYAVSQREATVTERPSGAPDTAARTADRQSSSEDDWARKFKNLIKATDTRAAKVVLFNISRGSQSDFKNLAKVFLELFLVAQQEWERHSDFDGYLSRVSTALLTVLSGARSQAGVHSERPFVTLGTCTQVDVNSDSHIIIDLQKLADIVEGLHEQDRSVQRVTIIAESLEVLASAEARRRQELHRELVPMDNDWDMELPSSPRGWQEELPPPPPEWAEERAPAGQVAVMGDLLGGNAPYHQRPQQDMGRPQQGPGFNNHRFGGPKINLPLLKNIIECNEFLLKFERVMNHFDILPRDRVLYLEQCVEGSRAETWLTNYLRNYQGQNFTVVEMAFRKAFCTGDEGRRLKTMIKGRVWRDGESVSDYFIDKMVLLSKFSTSMSMPERVAYIKEGLPHNWKVKLVGMTFATMEDMLDYLVAVEADLQDLRAGSALTPKAVTLGVPEQSVNAMGLEQLQKNLESLTVTVAALRDELKENRKRPPTPGPRYHERSYDRSHTPDRYRSRGGDWHRSPRRYGPDGSRPRSYSRGRDEGKNRSGSRGRSGDRSRKDRYERYDRYERREKDRRRDGSQQREPSKERQASWSRDKDSEDAKSKNWQK